MAYFEWTDALSVGNPYIDADHRRIIDIINALHSHMQKRAGTAVARDILQQLQVYTMGHFRREEEQMRVIGFPDLAAHRKQHQALLDQLTDFRRDFDERSVTQTIEISQFLYTWLTDHILESDMKLGAAMRGLEAPQHRDA